jgi:hypothetical protein
MASLQLRDIPPEIYQILSLIAQRENKNISQIINTLIKDSLQRRLRAAQEQRPKEPSSRLNYKEIAAIMNI